jgi:pyroglutamyl-peptidase
MLTRPTTKAKPQPKAKLGTGSKPRQATVLLTGFDAFGGDAFNPSWLAVQALHGKRVLGRKLVAAQLPTRFGRSLRVLSDLLKQHRPELVICVGLAGGRSAISLERVAININDARIADNAGELLVDTPVVKGGPDAYFTTLPIKAMLQAIQAEGIACEVSQTAGTFVCNHVFYGLMHALATLPALKKTRGGFVHVPFLPDQVPGNTAPSMAFDDTVRGLGIAVRAALKNQVDAVVAAGTIQ